MYTLISVHLLACCKQYLIILAYLSKCHFSANFCRQFCVHCAVCFCFYSWCTLHTQMHIQYMHSNIGVMKWKEKFLLWNSNYYFFFMFLMFIEFLHSLLPPHTHQTPFCVSNQKAAIYILDILCISLHFYIYFSCRCTYTHTCQYQLAINSGRTVHNDFTCQVWSCCVKLHTAECNGHREFQVSSDKWPRLAVDQQTRGLSDLSLHQQTLLQPLGLSTGCCTLSVFSSLAHIAFLLCQPVSLSPYHL